MMHDREKSDRLIVPRTLPNNAGGPAAEAVEGSERTKGNSPDGHDVRTQRRTYASVGPERVRQAAKRTRWQRFISMVSWVLDADIRGATTHGSTAVSSTVWRQSRASVFRTRTSAWRSHPR